MKKITIKDIEQTIKLLQTNEVSPKEDTDKGNFEEQLNNKLEIELAINKLCKQEQEIIQMILGGFSYNEIKCELKIGEEEINQALDNTRAIIK